ncbi:MAG TPA: aminotransferase class IV [Kofleriaceae bacterium]|nr:aminotransferase class IV [Kofleriaceae bacterium]
MPAKAWIDGAIVPLDEARVPVTDRGFLWGDHVFEIIRAEGRFLCDGDAHLARLARSASLVRMAPPDLAVIARAIAATVVAAAAGAPPSSASVRIVWTRGDARGLAPSTAGAGRLVITVEPLAATTVTSGVSLGIVHGARASLVPAAAKSGNYLASVLALAAAADAGADDALLVDAEGNVLETATANLFVVDAAGVTTPSGALLPGITAARVAQLLGEAGHTIDTAPVSLERARNATELFVTSARRGPVPVVALDGAPRETGAVTRAATVAYARWLERCAEGRDSPPLAYTEH